MIRKIKRAGRVRKIQASLMKHDLVYSTLQAKELSDVSFKLVKTFSKKGSVCYMALNKPFKVLKREFVRKGVHMDNLVVIDALTRRVKSGPDTTAGCYFVSSPADLGRIFELLHKMVRHKFKYIIIDSITDLLLYHGVKDVSKLIFDVREKIKAERKNSLRGQGASSTKLVILGLSVLEQNDLNKSLKAIVDKSDATSIKVS